MGFEIDYLPVGQKADDKSGDAIAMRFWDTEPNDAFVITIDGGTLDSGGALVEHIKNYYGTNTIDLAILTHPDADHASGIREVLEQMDVKQLWAFMPWEHAEEILPIVQSADARVTAESIEQRLKDAFPAAVEAIELAQKKDVAVMEPFADESIIEITDKTRAFPLSPTQEAYLTKWLPNYDCLPKQSSVDMSMFEKLLKGTQRVVQGSIKWIVESWDKELLLDPGANDVNAANNSSVILAIQQGLDYFLFCGDAGVPALEDALSKAEDYELPTDGFTFFHIPHHGSRHNLGPSILNKMFGKSQAAPDNNAKVFGYVSATKDDPKHPSRRITNALNRRGVKSVGTCGRNIVYRSQDAPNREGWSGTTTIPFYNEVEDVE